MTALEQELRAVAGVTRAHVDISEGEIARLHVELDETANREDVAAAVDVVLRRHGLRSRVSGSEAPAPESPPPSAPPEQEEAPHDEPTPGEQVVGTSAQPRISEVRVTHQTGRAEITVRTSDGAEETVTTVASEDAKHQAIAAVVARLAGASVTPFVIEVSRRVVGVRSAVTVVLDVGDDTVIGSCFERGSAELGLARAIWVALTA